MTRTRGAAAKNGTKASGDWFLFEKPRCTSHKSCSASSREDEMPLKRLYNEYSQQDGVNFAMADEEGGTVECHVSHEALQDYKDRLHHPGDDAEIFKAYREILERLASEMYDSGASYDQAGRLLITSDDFTHMTRTP